MFAVVIGESQQALTAPDAYDSQYIGIMPIDDAERRMDQLPKRLLPELRHHPSHSRMVREALDALQNPAGQPQTDLWRTIPRIPSDDVR